MKINTVKLGINASGAAEAARNGDVVVIVDVIDMSTTLEAALDAGALAVFGAAPDAAAPPVPINPEKVGLLAGRLAKKKEAEVILVAEPRVGSDEQRLSGITRLCGGLARTAAKVGSVLPNIGAETVRLCDFRDKVVIAATSTGGVAYDAAVQAGAQVVLTGTVARTMSKKGSAPARAAASRAIKHANLLNTGITVVAASGNSMEDILAAEYITKAILEEYQRLA
ncbi:hypothetical protein SAMN05660649_00109 [Desulfotomaculum arcticum]|uniref:2-phosphosulfolactate phosphatase n=1 Tax=Desulfotruncus arcticus DSM 17038 TaxID=1121424 RepID=A0A1I2MXD8_9FIRM|nr:hypothetical protein [Desulfotruncus arcticus]SFF94117.1 hypothetical protein SAMN05660649_00109 [Desulfotomaculum arcticum] [Desulfotruncus arcticus DSM 17038]